MGESADDGVTLCPDGYRGEGGAKYVVVVAMVLNIRGLVFRFPMSCTVAGLAVCVKVSEILVIIIFTIIYFSNSATTDVHPLRRGLELAVYSPVHPVLPG